MNFNEFNILDIVVLSVILLSTIFAIFRGLIGSVLSLVGWVLSIYLTYLVYPYIEPLLSDKISNKVVLTSLGYGGLMLFFLIIFAIFNSFISSVRLLGSRFLDSTLGGAFGFFRGFLVVSFFYLFLSIGISLVNGTDSKDEAKVAPQWLKSAQTYNLLRFGKQFLLSFTSQNFNKRLDSFYESVSDKTRDERFISYATEVMLRSIPSSERKNIEDVNSKDYLTKSDEEVSNNTLKSLLNSYQKQMGSSNFTGSNDNNGLSKDDIKRLEEIINNFRAKNNDKG